MRTFKVGDRVVIVKSTKASRIGEVCSVTSALHVPNCTDESLHAAGDCWCAAGSPLVHTLDIPTDPGTRISYPPSHLEPYRRDSAERGEWTDELRKLCRLGVKEEA